MWYCGFCLHKLLIIHLYPVEVSKIQRLVFNKVFQHWNSFFLKAEVFTKREQKAMQYLFFLLTCSQCFWVYLCMYIEVGVVSIGWYWHVLDNNCLWWLTLIYYYFKMAYTEKCWNRNRFNIVYISFCYLYFLLIYCIFLRIWRTFIGITFVYNISLEILNICKFSFYLL